MKQAREIEMTQSLLSAGGSSSLAKPGPTKTGPLVGADDDMAPAVAGAILSANEFTKLCEQLDSGKSALPSSQQLGKLRAGTANRMLWTFQLRQIAATIDGGKHFFQECFELKKIADPEELTVKDGPWVQKTWFPTSPEQQAKEAKEAKEAKDAAADKHGKCKSYNFAPIAVVHGSGRVATLKLDRDTATVSQAIELASANLGLPANSFNSKRHQVVAVCLPQEGGLQLGAYVKVSGVTQPETINGKIGQIIRQEGDQQVVSLAQGIFQLNKDNLVPWNAMVVARNTGRQVSLSTRLKELGPAARLLWLDIPNHVKDTAADGPMQTIKAQLSTMSATGSQQVSFGEFRNFLWNLHLEDGAFETVAQRFSRQSTDKKEKRKDDFLDIDQVIFLLGRSHLLAPEVSIDSLVYEAVLSILGRRTTAHIDRDLGEKDAGIGCAQAGKKHCCSIFWMLFCSVGAAVLLIIGIIGAVTGGGFDGWPFVGAAILYIIYVSVNGCKTPVGSSATVQGMEAVMEAMDLPRSDELEFTWRVTNYHYETRTSTRTDAEGRTETVYEQVRVETFSTSYHGVIPSSDYSPDYVPDPHAQQTLISTDIYLNYESSNYLQQYQLWCLMHHWDVHQDCYRDEDLPSRRSKIVAVWVPGTQPWWFARWCCCLAHIFFAGVCYRWRLIAAMGAQEYAYHRVCYNIEAIDTSTILVAGVAAGMNLAARVLRA